MLRQPSLPVRLMVVIAFTHCFAACAVFLRSLRTMLARGSNE
jgi:hypothetical protein